jgi:hypothetical protein
MNSQELMRYARGEVVPRRQSRQVARAAREIHDELRISKVEAAGLLDYAASLMYGLHDLNQIRKEVAGDDPLEQMMLAEVMANSVRQVTSLQRQLYTEL